MRKRATQQGKERTEEERQAFMADVQQLAARGVPPSGIARVYGITHGLLRQRVHEENRTKVVTSYRYMNPQERRVWEQSVEDVIASRLPSDVQDGD